MTSNTEKLELMKQMRFSLTCAPGGENHVGMQLVGRAPIKGEGLTSTDMEGLGPYFTEQHSAKSVLLDLNGLSLNDTIDDLKDEDQARVLILKGWVNSVLGQSGTLDIFSSLFEDKWDAEYLDPNKYRTEIVDGKEVKVRGQPRKKHARRNITYAYDMSQEPAVLEGKGRIADLNFKPELKRAVEIIRQQVSDGLIAIGSKTKVEINVVEGNHYYNLKNTGIGYHGDTERVIVICLCIGGEGYPMVWQWFKDSMPVGKPIPITLNDGDVYIMSEKAVGAEWKLSSKYTLRHAAGAEKYRSISKWEKKRPAYETKLKARADAKKLKDDAKLARSNAKKLKDEAKLVRPIKNDSKNKGKTTKGGALKIVDPEKQALRKYKNALRKLNWGDCDAAFYKWVAVEAGYSCSPKNAIFKEFQAIWTGEKQAFTEFMDNKDWEEKRTFYRNLCEYRSVLW